MPGDIISSLIDLDQGEISFWRNNKFLGVAFDNVKTGPNCAYFPAISLQRGERVIFNFGLRPFHVKLPFQPCALNEPTSLVKNLEPTAELLLTKLMLYSKSFNETKHQ